MLLPIGVLVWLQDVKVLSWLQDLEVLSWSQNTDVILFTGYRISSWLQDT